MQVKPFALSRTLTKPFRSSTYTPAPLRRCSGAALSAKAISLSRGRTSGNCCAVADRVAPGESNCGNMDSAYPNVGITTKQAILDGRAFVREVIYWLGNEFVVRDLLNFTML